MTKPFLPLSTRIMSGIDKKDDCWIWRGYKGKQGYGVMGISRKSTLAHRASYSAFVGDIPQGMHVLHKCDMPSCVNPEHLFLGTNSDNVADKVSKGRTHEKLSDAQVREIRRRYVPGLGRTLAKEFKVSPMTISLTVRGKLHKEAV